MTDEQVQAESKSNSTLSGMEKTVHDRKSLVAGFDARTKTDLAKLITLVCSQAEWEVNLSADILDCHNGAAFLPDKN
jgi:hypothetical protein